MDEDIGGTLEAYKAANPTHKSVMVRILKAGYHALQLIHYFTSGADEVRGWTIKDGWLAPQAAGEREMGGGRGGRGAGRERVSQEERGERYSAEPCMYKATRWGGTRVNNGLGYVAVKY